MPADFSSGDGTTEQKVCLKNLAMVLAFSMLLGTLVAFSQALSGSVHQKQGFFECNESYGLDGSLFPQRYSHIAVSSFLLNRLAAAEETIYKILLAYMRKTSSERSDDECRKWFIQRYKTHFEESSVKIRHGFKRQHKSFSSRALNVAWNPLASFLMLRRIVFLLRPLYARTDAESELNRLIRTIMSETGWPTSDDLRTAERTILRVQIFYNLTTTALANGNLAGVNTGLSLSSRDCNALSQYALDHNEYALAVEWQEEAQRKVARGGNMEAIFPIRREALEQNLRWSIIKHDAALDENGVDIGCYVAKLKNGLPLRARPHILGPKHWKDAEVDINFRDTQIQAICGGKSYQTEEHKSKLFCFYESKRHPGLLIGPIKVEIISIDPFPVIRFFDLIGDKTIDTFLEDFESNMDDSLFFNTDREIKVTRECKPKPSTSFIRQDTFLTECSRLERIIQKVMGLHPLTEINNEGSLRFISYPPGGHILLHRDGFNQAVQKNFYRLLEGYGNRVATVVFYLSNVIKGGWTAFPQSGVAVKPIRGSAILWYNLKRSIVDDHDFSWHAGCPVILGEKLGWIMSNDQMFVPHFKCDPYKDATFGYRLTKMKSSPIHEAHEQG